MHMNVSRIRIFHISVSRFVTKVPDNVQQLFKGAAFAA